MCTKQPVKHFEAPSPATAGPGNLVGCFWLRRPEADSEQRQDRDSLAPGLLKRNLPVAFTNELSQRRGRLETSTRILGHFPHAHLVSLLHQRLGAVYGNVCHAQGAHASAACLGASALAERGPGGAAWLPRGRSRRGPAVGGVRRIPAGPARPAVRNFPTTARPGWWPET